jgi:hypothetical protein
MAVEAAGQPTTMLIPPAEQFGTELSILDLGAHLRADMHASARPFQDRLIALAALWANTETGKKVLTHAHELEATGNRIRFQAEGEPSPPAPASDQPTETVMLRPHLLDIGATEIGVPPDVEHSCELMKNVVTALNVLSARVTPSEASHVGELMDPEQLASELRKELKESNNAPKPAPPERPPAPHHSLIPTSLRAAAEVGLQNAAVGAGSDPEVPAGAMPIPLAPDEADKPAPYSSPTRPEPAQARKRWGLPWLRRRANDAVAILRLFGSSRASADQGGETLVKKSGKRREARPVETALRKESMPIQAVERRHSAPSTVAPVLEILRRDSKEIDKSPMVTDGGQKNDEAGITGQEGFKRKHRRTASGVWGRLKSALPGARARQQTSYQQFPGTRENSLSVPSTPKGSVSESAFRRPSMVSQQALEASAADAPITRALMPEALVPEAPVPDAAVTTASVTPAPVTPASVTSEFVTPAPVTPAPVPTPILEARADDPATTL